MLGSRSGSERPDVAIGRAGGSIISDLDPSRGDLS
jgi:hypothetical protein